MGRGMKEEERGDLGALLVLPAAEESVGARRVPTRAPHVAGPALKKYPVSPAPSPAPGPRPPPPRARDPPRVYRLALAQGRTLGRRFARLIYPGGGYGPGSLSTFQRAPSTPTPSFTSTRVAANAGSGLEHVTQIYKRLDLSTLEWLPKAPRTLNGKFYLDPTPTFSYYFFSSN